MTKAEYKRRYDDYNSQIINLQKKIMDLKAEYIEHSPVKVGDKVEVTQHGKTSKTTICFVSSVEVGRNGDYDYCFAKVKKDGTMSGQSAGIYYADSIKLIEPANKPTAI